MASDLSHGAAVATGGPAGGGGLGEARPDLRRVLIALGVMLVVMVAYVKWQGRVWFCECGQIMLVSTEVNSSHNSQHLLDPYSLSHMLHGILFFGLLWLVRRWVGPAGRFTIAAAIEVAWEMLENSPIVIDRYRAATISLGYSGDSVVNSLGDVASFVVGYWLAGRLGLWRSVVLFVAVELAMLWLMRDNLTLNVLMLLWPIDAIRSWQAG